MALFDFKKLDFFTGLNARSRIAVLLAGIVGFVLIIYFGTKYLSGGSKTTGPSKVATPPSSLQSVQGGQLSPEYYRSVAQANAQAAQQAQITGASAMPTLVNVPGGAGQANCIICTEDSANVKNLLDDWLRQGKIDPQVANELAQLADKNVSVDDYAAALDRLVREGKLTPEQARMLLEQYKRQHANGLLQDSAKLMDGMIKSGQLPIDVANQLLDAQRKGMSPSEYAAALQKLVRDGKISPETAQRLLSQYAQQFAKQVTLRSIAILEQWSAKGEITPDVLKELVRLENGMVPLDTMANSLQDFVAKGRLTPAVATKVLDEFKAQKAEIGASSTIQNLLQQAEAAAFEEISTLLQSGKISADTAAQLTDMIQRNVPFAEFSAAVQQMVQQKKLTPEIAQLKLGDYKRIKDLRDAQAKLANLQANNASAEQYADALKQAVAGGVLTPEDAAALLREYQALRIQPLAAPVAAGPGAGQFAALQQRVQQATPGAAPIEIPASEFATAQVAVAEETVQDRQARIQGLISAMSGQAQQLISSWGPPTMQEKAGSYETPKSKEEAAAGAGGKAGTASQGASETGMAGAPLIKAGSILFAVLDSAVNSDYPDSPVLATIVTGPYKGAKLLGKLVTTKGVGGQLDRVSLNFTIMNLDAWPKSKSVTAYAIDPDTARTVLASSVDYHYMKRFGSIMATSFLQGYANAITSSASTTTTGIFGTSTTHPQLSPGNKLAVGLGQVGQTLGNVTQNWINIPPTVRVDSGVGLGILFMSDVSG